jgi:hypothetical protein
MGDTTAADNPAFPDIPSKIERPYLLALFARHLLRPEIPAAFIEPFTELLERQVLDRKFGGGFELQGYPKALAAHPPDAAAMVWQVFLEQFGIEHIHRWAASLLIRPSALYRMPYRRWEQGNLWNPGFRLDEIPERLEWDRARLEQFIAPHANRAPSGSALANCVIELATQFVRFFACTNSDSPDAWNMRTATLAIGRFTPVFPNGGPDAQVAARSEPIVSAPLRPPSPAAVPTRHDTQTGEPIHRPAHAPQTSAPLPATAVGLGGPSTPRSRWQPSRFDTSEGSVAFDSTIHITATEVTDDPPGLGVPAPTLFSWKQKRSREKRPPLQSLGTTSANVQIFARTEIMKRCEIWRERTRRADP